MSQAPIGFIILSHRNPEQLVKLLNRLNSMFNDPPIVCHHDFSQCDLVTTGFPPSVRFVRDYIKTSWGGFSLVVATLAALRLLYDNASAPEWFVLLSASDYPTKDADTILDELGQSSYDAYIQYLAIGPDVGRGDVDTNDERWKTSHHRYMKKYLTLPSLSLSRGFETWRYELPGVATRRLLPFSERFRCYAGWQWFTANVKCAKYILKGHRKHRALDRHYRGIPVPDESYFQTILLNNPSLRICGNNLRYTDWSNKGSHPKTLGFEDLPQVFASGAHFARKFDIARDPEILDRLDEMLGSETSSGVLSGKSD